MHKAPKGSSNLTSDKYRNSSHLKTTTTKTDLKPTSTTPVGKTNNRAKKGISPVIATVILVAVAVVIAAALAGFAGSLFGSYSNGPQVKVQSMTVHAANGAPTAEVTLSNSGNAADTITKITLNNIGDTGQIAAGNVVGANTGPTLYGPYNVNLNAGATAPIEGQQVSAVISMQSGATLTQTVTVVA